MEYNNQTTIKGVGYKFSLHHKKIMLVTGAYAIVCIGDSFAQGATFT